MKRFKEKKNWTNSDLRRFYMKSQDYKSLLDKIAFFNKQYEGRNGLGAFMHDLLENEFVILFGSQGAVLKVMNKINNK